MNNLYKPTQKGHGYEDNYAYYHAVFITTLIESYKYILINHLIII